MDTDGGGPRRLDRLIVLQKTCRSDESAGEPLDRESALLRIWRRLIEWGGV
jgi:hypothetical protein